VATPKITTIQVTTKVRDRLKRHGLKGQSYSQLLDALMDRLEYEEFMEEQYRRVAERGEFTPLHDLE
jgi:hypothetical protein